MSPVDDPAPQSRFNTSWPFFALTGVGAVGLGGFIGFGLHARSLDRALDDCTPGCSPERLDPVRTNYLLANVGLAVGIAGVTAAAAWLLFVPVSREPDSLRVGVLPTAGGAESVVSGSF